MIHESDKHTNITRKTRNRKTHTHNNATIQNIKMKRTQNIKH